MLLIFCKVTYCSILYVFVIDLSHPKLFTKLRKLEDSGKYDRVYGVHSFINRSCWNFRNEKTSYFGNDFQNYPNKIPCCWELKLKERRTMSFNIIYTILTKINTIWTIQWYLSILYSLHFWFWKGIRIFVSLSQLA